MGELLLGHPQLLPNLSDGLAHVLGHVVLSGRLGGEQSLASRPT
jgi:hypothetical protein